MIAMEGKDVKSTSDPEIKRKEINGKGREGKGRKAQYHGKLEGSKLVAPVAKEDFSF